MTLADLSAWIRTALKWVLLATVALAALWIGWIIVTGLISSLFRPQGADTAYGVLDPPIFSQTYSFFKSKTYENEATLPKSSKKLAVFQFENSEKFTKEQQNKISSFFGLVSTEKSETDGLITWKKKSETTNLKLDVSSSHFIFKRDLSKDKRLLNSKVNLDQNQALKKTVEIFKKINISLDNKNIDADKTIIKYFNILVDSRKETSASNANAVEIKFFRKIGKVLSSGDAPIRILLAEKGNKILEFDYYFSPLNPLGAPYPIITSSQAWEEIRSGNAFSDSKKEFNAIKVAKVTLTYWESKFFQPYLQPVWLFTGVGETNAGEIEFGAVVPAISPDYLSSESEQQPSDQPPPAAP